MEIAVYQNHPKEEWAVFINHGDVIVHFETLEDAQAFALKLTREHLDK